MNVGSVEWVRLERIDSNATRTNVSLENFSISKEGKNVGKTKQVSLSSSVRGEGDRAGHAVRVHCGAERARRWGRVSALKGQRKNWNSKTSARQSTVFLRFNFSCLISFRWCSWYHNQSRFFITLGSRKFVDCYADVIYSAPLRRETNRTISSNHSVSLVLEVKCCVQFETKKNWTTKLRIQVSVRKEKKEHFQALLTLIHNQSGLVLFHLTKVGS